MEFTMLQKVKLCVGAHTVGRISELLQDLGKKKPLLVCDEGIRACGILAKATDALEAAGVAYAVFSEVKPDPNVSLAEDGYQCYLREGCDGVIALGGGSTIDIAKAINILVYNDKPLLYFAEHPDDMEPAPGLIVVPTTSGTGSEMSDGLVLTSGDTKYPILATKAMAEYAVLDPALTTGLPAGLTASTGLDALSHVVEGYTTNTANPFTDLICEKVMESVRDNLPRATHHGEDLNARQAMSVASNLGGWMLSLAHTNAGHSVAHVLGGMFHIPHGYACAYALPEVVAFNAPALPEKTRRIGAIFGARFDGAESPEEIGQKTRDALIRFRDEEVGLRKAGTFSVDPARFAQAAQAIAEEPFQAFNVVSMSQADALAILHRIFD